MKGVDDLDFFIGDEAIEKPTYATKVCVPRDPVSCLSLTLYGLDALMHQVFLFVCFLL